MPPPAKAAEPPRAKEPPVQPPIHPRTRTAIEHLKEQVESLRLQPTSLQDTVDAMQRNINDAEGSSEALPFQ